MPTVTGAGRCGNTRPVSACAVGDGAAGPGLRWAGRAPPGLASHRLLFPRRILLNYAVFNPAIGYSQGMSDLVAPLLAEILDESDTFWCFVGLMQNTIFFSSPRDEDMEKQLVRPMLSPAALAGAAPLPIRAENATELRPGVPAQITLQGHQIPGGSN